MYDLAPSPTSFIQDIFYKAEKAAELGYDPDVRGSVMDTIQRQKRETNWLPSEHWQIVHKQERGEVPRHGSAVVIASTIDPVTHKHGTLLKRFFNNAKDREFNITETLLDDTLLGEADRYMNMQGFGRWRVQDQSIYSTSHYLDVDLVDIPHDRRNDLDDYAAELVARLVFEGIQMPSYVMASGRGLNFVWLTNYRVIHNFNRTQANRQWKRRQTALMRVADKIGIPYDKSVSDITRIFRFTGTINSKSGKTVRPLFVNGEWKSPYFVSPNEFYNACQESLLADVVPQDTPSVAAQIGQPTPEQAVKLAPELAIGVTQNPVAQTKVSKRHAGSKNISSWANIVHDDMKKIIEHRYNNCVPKGQRDTFVFLAVAVKVASLNLSETHAEMQLLQNSEALEVFEDFAELTDAPREKLWRAMSSTFDRLNRSRAGEKSDIFGDRDQRYRYTRTTLIEKLNVSRDDMLSLDLRALVDDDIKATRQREAVARHRGQVSPALPKTVRDAQRAERHAAILNCWTENQNIKLTARTLNCSKNTVKSVLRKQGVNL